MPINIRDKFKFLFNDGKGVEASQVQSAIANPPQGGDDVDSWLSHLISLTASEPNWTHSVLAPTGAATNNSYHLNTATLQLYEYSGGSWTVVANLKPSWSIPQSLSGSCSGSVNPGTQQVITFSGVGSEASWASLALGSVGNPPPPSGNLVIRKAGTYRFFGEIAYTGNDRTGPTFQAQRIGAGTAIINLGHTNAYSRDADTELIIDRQLDFYVPDNGTTISISVWNREVTASTGGTYGTLTFTSNNVDNMYLLPIGAVSQ